MTMTEKISVIKAWEKNQGYIPDSMLNVMLFETAGTLDPAKKNANGSSAVGLIQFMASTAKALGTTTEALAAMTIQKQLEYVEKYMAPYKKQVIASGDFLDTYLAVLCPALIGKPDSAYLRDSLGNLAKDGTKVYLQNKGLDIDKDGDIQKGDIRAYFVKNVNYARVKNLLSPTDWASFAKSPAGLAGLAIVAALTLYFIS